MPSLQQLRYLVALADMRNFSRAAELCNVSQPTLSVQLKDMEARLGTVLVERTRARVIMTPVGLEVARRARQILGEIEDIREIARRDDPEAPQARFQLGVVPTVGAYVLSLAMPQLRESFPHMRLEVREERAEVLLAQLQEGAHDAILLPEAVAPRPDLIAATLAHEAMQLVLPADHRLASHGAVAPEDLRGETLLSIDGGPELHAHMLALCREVGAHHLRDYERTTLDTLRQMVATGMGISLMPALYVRSEVMREQLVVARKLASGVPMRPITLLWRANSSRQRTCAALAETIRARLAPWSARPVSPATDTVRQDRPAS